MAGESDAGCPQFRSRRHATQAGGSSAQRCPRPALHSWGTEARQARSTRQEKISSTVDALRRAGSFATQPAAAAAIIFISHPLRAAGGDSAARRAKGRSRRTPMTLLWVTPPAALATILRRHHSRLQRRSRSERPAAMMTTLARRSQRSGQRRRQRGGGGDGARLIRRAADQTPGPSPLRDVARALDEHGPHRTSEGEDHRKSQQSRREHDGEGARRLCRYALQRRDARRACRRRRARATLVRRRGARRLQGALRRAQPSRRAGAPQGAREVRATRRDAVPRVPSRARTRH